MRVWKFLGRFWRVLINSLSRRESWGHLDLDVARSLLKLSGSVPSQDRVFAKCRGYKGLSVPGRRRAKEKVLQKA